MITFFTVPKAFQGLVGVIQRNAIANWLALVPGAQVILFGDETGVAAAATDLGVTHVSDLRRSPHGAPLLDGVMREAHRRAAHRTLALVNADILFGGDVGRVTAGVGEPFLVIGESRDVDIREPLPFDDLQWRQRIPPGGGSRGPLALDYFFFSRGLFGEVPPFALGRARYDNWLVWRALSRRAAIVDATETLEAIHQRHDYGHLPGGRREAYRGLDAQRNQALAGWWCYLHVHGVHDATWTFTPAGLRRRHGRTGFLMQLRTRFAGLVAEARGRQGHGGQESADRP
jgi:hypothetical protein